MQPKRHFQNPCLIENSRKNDLSRSLKNETKIMKILYVMKFKSCRDVRRKWQPTPVFLPGESQGWGSLVGCRLWGRTESDTTEATQQQQQQLACEGSPYCPRDSQESSPTPQFKSINSWALSFLRSPTLPSIHDYWKNHSLD